MIITKPAYFDSFRCIAAACPDSCCKEWDVQVDEGSAAYYRALPGPLGDRLRQVLRSEDGETVMTIVDGRCPMWRSDGLCRIQAELGEGALCHTCREFPRLTHDYGDFIERGLELSCPEAARIILSALPMPPVVEELPGGEGEYDGEAMAVLKATRETALGILAENRPMGQVLALLLLFGCQAQSELDGGEPQPFDPETALEGLEDFVKPGDLSAVVEIFNSLEILTPQWQQRLYAPASGELSQLCRPLARYLIERYWLQAVSDYDLYCRVKFIVVSCLLVSTLGGDFVSTAQLYSKEIENNTDNVEALLDAAYTHPALTDDKLLGLLLQIRS
ncbi:MAG: flagellin lysine-N-methylase [Oscillospiraceae bacterium]|nr:flagellin lysine-N-methylase [Oscillospiraceae bacterium]